MPPLLQQLENNEAVLLMYLADELPSEDRLEVEQMIASDPGMERELKQLRLAQQTVLSGLNDLDQATPMPVSESVTLRQVSRVMKQWHVDRFTRPPQVAEVRPQLRFPWWVYPCASAASILIATMVWWGFKPETSDPSPQRSDDPQLAFQELRKSSPH